MGRTLVGVRSCNNCNKDIDIYEKRRMNNKTVYCCKECQDNSLRSKDLNTICITCGKLYHLKPYSFNRTKKHCCSKSCFSKSKEIYMKGDGNHQYGLKGSLNDSWKSDERISSYGYRQIRSLNHPFKDHAGFVFEHRLIAEKYLLTDNNCIIIDGLKFLSKDYHVHHIDFNKLNNNISNLVVMSAGEHMKYHSKLRCQEKDSANGRFIKSA